MSSFQYSPCLILWQLQLGFCSLVPLLIYVVGHSWNFLKKWLIKRNCIDLNGKVDSDSKCYKYMELLRLQMFAVKTLGGKNKFGKILSIVRLATILTSGTIFVYVTYRENSKENASKSNQTYAQIYYCIPCTTDRLLILDAILQFVFLFIFLIKIIGAENILYSLISVDAIVDYSTILPQIIMLFHGYCNYAFRFLVFARLKNTPNILVQLNLIKQTRHIVLLKLIFSFLSIWLTGAGVYHILNSLDDNFNPVIPKFDITYFESFYFLLITMSTVGFGDITPVTVPSRLFILIFVVFAIGTFATYVPQIMSMVSLKPQYSDSYVRRKGIRHIVVCGNVKYSSVVYFLKDFYHRERREDSKNIQIVFLSEYLPDAQLETVLSRKWTKIKYLHGRVSNNNDLKRAKIRCAQCVIILSDTSSSNADDTDWSNILKVIAFKQYQPDIQIIVQILEYRNKQLLRCIPEWDPDRIEGGPDKVVCMKELKMGMLAQSALVPGFSTLFTDCLSYASSSRNFKGNPRDKDWCQKYLQGSHNTLSNVNFSSAFCGMSFTEAVRISYVNLSVILLAVVMKEKNERHIQVKINPSDNITIKPDVMTALVLAPSSRAAKKMEFFCQTCHATSHNLANGFIDNMMKRKKHLQCTCSHISSNNLSIDKRIFNRRHSVLPRFSVKFPNDNNVSLDCESFDHGSLDKIRKYSGSSTPDMSRAFVDYDDTSSLDLQFDQTRLFHWNKEKKFDDMILTPRQAMEMDFSNHVVVFLMSFDVTSSIDFSPFILPLRSSQITREELRDIIIIGNVNCLRGEWISIKNLSHIYLINDSPLNDTLLHLINLKNCYSCIILSQKKQAFDSSINRTISAANHMSSVCSNCAHTISTDTNDQEDREAVLCSLNIRKHLIRHRTQKSKHNFIITELKYDSNSNYIYPDRVGSNIKLGYASGAIFNVSKLNILMSTYHFNPTALLFLETLLAGESSKMVENIYSRGLGLIPNNRKSNVDFHNTNYLDDNLHQQCRLCLLELSNPVLRLKCKPVIFKDLFLGLLDKSKIICLGLYRQIGRTTHRFVYTFPDPSELLLDNDMVYFLQAYDDNCPNLPC